MKKIFLKVFYMVFFTFALQAFTAEITLTPGLYKAISASRSDVCEQEVRPIFWDETLHSLKVYYVGDCYFQGPYFYMCNQEGVCEDQMQIRFIIKSDSTFRWENNAYDIWGEFELQKRN